MPKSHDRPLRCPVCGYEATFTLNVATIHGVNILQTAPLQFRRDSRSLKQFDFYHSAVLFLPAVRAGHPAAAESHRRRTEGPYAPPLTVLPFPKS